MVVNIIECAHPNFKYHPFISMEDDPKSAFLSMPYEVLHNEKIMVYTHCSIEELRSSQMLNLFNNRLSNQSSKLKPKFQGLESKGFVQFVKFLMAYT